MDMISSLPDALLCHILSFLPTRTSVATCVLSSRWRHIWEHLQVLDFYDTSFSEPEVGKHFFAFVNAVLAQRSALHIRKFRLSCKAETDDEHDVVGTWIDAAIGPRLQELHIFFSSLSVDEILLPHSLFTCAALVSLTLVGDLIWEELPSVHLPSLKKLEVNILCVYAVGDLFIGCPVLETLKLVFHFCNAPIIQMPPSLKSLTFEDDSEVSEIDNLVIDNLSLEFLDINIHNRCKLYSIDNLHNVVEANLDIQSLDEHVGLVLGLLKALSRTKFLTLSLSTTECLLRAPTLDFVGFFCLLQLQLDIPYFDSRLLIKLLHCCPMLQVLKIYNWKSELDGSDQTLQAIEPSSWTLPTSVPNCVKLHLAVFEFREFKDSADEHEFAAYILERGFALKMMAIYTPVSMGLKKKHQILKGLSVIPRGSNMCQLQFE